MIDRRPPLLEWGSGHFACCDGAIECIGDGVDYLDRIRWTSAFE